MSLIRGGCSVFRPAFRCLQHLKAGWNIFFSSFSTFFVHFKAFSVISRLKSTKNVWKWTKKTWFFLLFFLVTLYIIVIVIIKTEWRNLVTDAKNAVIIRLDLYNYTMALPNINNSNLLRHNDELWHHWIVILLEVVNDAAPWSLILTILLKRIV